MKVLIIIPAHNEEENIQLCLDSLKGQTFGEFSCIIVNDGSTDKTLSIAQETIQGDAKFRIINLPQSQHQPGAKVVRTFNAGLQEVKLKDFDIVCKFDADIIFPNNYLESIVKTYQNHPKAGMVSGLVYIQNKEGRWIFENLSSKNHVRGPIKSYRVKCFQDMNGLRPLLGWDNIDVMLAKMHQWEVVTLKDIWVKHLRPTAYKYKSQKAEKLGQYFYNIGLNFPLAFISSLKSSLKNKSITELWITLRSFLSQKHERALSPKEISYIRKLRWKQMFRKK